MKKRTVTVAYIFVLLLCVTIKIATAEQDHFLYEKPEYWFSIIRPNTWRVEEQELGYKFTVKFLSNDGNIVVAIKEPMDFHKKIIGLVKEKDLNQSQLSDLGNMIYSKVPGVQSPQVFITKLANERALGSTYFYKLETMGSILGYMRVLKLETLHKGKFYKLEVSSPLANTPKDADRAFNKIWPIFETSIKSFVFLPY